MPIDHLIGEIDSRIARLMPEVAGASPLYGMMRYHLGWVDESLRPSGGASGKRVRGTLCLAVCQAAGGSPEAAIAPATAVELVHNFSLIHDDIQDGAEYRRHRRTVWVIWGEAQAINAGDAMLTLAQLALLEDQQSDPCLVVRALRELNRTCQLLTEGQYLDLDFERRPMVTPEEYRAMIERKTAALIETSCLLGALYGRANEETLQAYARFGRQLGIAFQIQDDYLGIWGDPAMTGKPRAADVVGKKKTFPILFAMAATTGSDRERLAEIMSSPEAASETEAGDVLAILDRCGAAERTAAEVQQATRDAMVALVSARPEPEAYEMLAELCRKLSTRAG